MLEEAFRAAHKVLLGHNVDFFIIGGVSVGVLGDPRFTKDIDFVIMAIDMSRDDLRALLASFGGNGFALDVQRTMEKLMSGRPAKLLYTRRISVDLRLGSYTVDKHASLRKIPVTIFDVATHIATPEDIILYKIPSDRKIDARDIESILTRHEGKLDLAYLCSQGKILADELQNPKVYNKLISLGLCS